MGRDGGDSSPISVAVAGGRMIALPGMAQIWSIFPEARMVGGAVRDLLAGREVADVDFAVPLPPEAVMARAKAAWLRFVPTGLAHGTVTLLAAGRGFEMTSLRQDVETDGRHARVEFTANWQADAARRDFTINAMSCDQDGRIFDYFDGKADLAVGMIRFVGPARQRIAEDYLRVLRFFRFFARYGQGQADAEAVAAIMAARDGLSGLSPERVWSEVKKILEVPAPLASIWLMQETSVLESILPGAVPDRLAALLARGAPVDPLLRLAALTNEDLAKRLRLSAAQARRLAGLRTPFSLSPDDDEARLNRALADRPREILIGQSWLHGGDDAGWADLRARLEVLKVPVFPLLGRDLAAMGIPAGPEMGEVLASIRQWWWEGGCLAGKAACLARVERAGVVTGRATPD